MSLIPDILHLKTSDETQTLDISVSGSGQQQIVTTGSLRVQCQQSLSLQSYDLFIKPAGNIGIVSSDESHTYFLPNAQTAPQANQTIVFAADGTSSFQTIAVPESVAYNPAQANQNMAGYQVNNAVSLGLVNGENTLDIKPYNGDAGAATIQATAPLAIIGAQSMAFVANGGPLQLGSNVGIRVINNGVQNYNLPTTTPAAGQVMVAQSGGQAGAAVNLSFETLNIPQNVAYNPAQANQDMAGFSVSGATNYTSANYNLESVGAESSDNVDRIAALEEQVSTLESKVAALSSVILNAFGIVIP